MPNHPSIIARPTASGFAGRYVHNDGHPGMRMALLRDLYAGPFGRDLEAITRFLVDEHPAGWSQLGPDPAVDTGWNNQRSSIGYRHFICYCHGDRHEEPHLLTENDADPLLNERVYVLRADGIELWETTPSGSAWRINRIQSWAYPRPDIGEAA